MIFRFENLKNGLKNMANYHLVERSIITSYRFCLELIDFIKYLNCPDCIESGLYCSKHKVEVEKILQETENN